jgi:hypothetical protein
MDEWLDELLAALHHVELRLDHVGGVLLPVRPDPARDRARREWRKAMDALGEVIAQTEAGYQVSASALDAARSSLAAELLREDEMRRRDLLGYTGMLSAAAILPADVRARIAVKPTSVDRGVLDAYAAATASYARGFYVVAPDNLLGVVRSHVNRLAAVGDASMSPDVRTRWGSLLSDTAGLAGELALDADRMGEALAYFGLARDVAAQVGDATLQALAVTLIGLLHSPQYGGDAKVSSWYTREGSMQLPADAPGYVRAWVLGQAAKEAAAAGRPGEFFRGMELVEREVERRASGRHLDGFWSDSACYAAVGGPGWAGRFAGRGLAYLGHVDAHATLTRSLDEATDPRDVAALAHALAEYHLRREEPEQAAAAAARALGVIPKWTARVRALRERMDPWADLPAVHDLDEALAVTR